MEQNRYPRNKPCICGQLIYTKEPRIYNTVSSINGVFFTCKRMKPDHYLILYTKKYTHTKNSKWTKVLNIDLKP